MKVLVLCTGNSARSRMAEGFLRALDPQLEVYSAGTHPAERVNPQAVEVMREVGIDLGAAGPKAVDRFLAEPFDVVITVCGDAERSCPAFSGRVGRRVHIAFEDPARARGSDDHVRAVFRRVRDEIHVKMKEFLEEAWKT